MKCCDKGLYLQHFIFSITYKWAQKARGLDSTSLERFAKDKQSSLLCSIISNGENKDKGDMSRK